MKFPVGQVGIGTLLRRTGKPSIAPSGPALRAEQVLDELRGCEMLVTRLPWLREVVFEITSVPDDRRDVKVGQEFEMGIGFLDDEYFQILDPRTKEPIRLTVLDKVAR